MFSGLSTLDSIQRSANVREFGGRPSKDVDLLLWLGGDREKLAEMAERTLDTIRQQFSDWHVTLLVDGPEWANLASTLPCGRQISLPRSTSLPQALFSLALESAKLPWAAFAWPGSEPDAGVLTELRNNASDADLIYAQGVLPIPLETPHPIQHGRLQMSDSIPMERCLLATQAAARVPFDCSPVLQRFFWWEFTIRLSRHGRIASRECAAGSKARVTWRDYPFSSPAPIEPDTAARYINAGNDFQAFFNDLADLESDALLRACEQWHRQVGLTMPAANRVVRRGDPWPIRVLVLGGIFEPHHNELCFYRCFEKLRGSGYLTWRPMLYEQCPIEDLQHYNLVIFTRPRYPGCSTWMDECQKHAVGTLVMIDDNWITIARERPRYEFLFGTGKPALETFLYCLRQADHTVVYNPILAEDIAPFAGKVTKLSPYIDPSAFACDDRRKRGAILAGYSGSPRPETPAFQALAHFAERHPDVELLCFGPLQMPPELLSVDPSRICSAPFQVSYEGYAKRIGRLNPDILIAPLDDCRTAASKAPNKFLEISIVGAAGVYSRVAPYTRYVRDGETGLLVDNQEQCWTEALERLYCDRGLLAAIAAAARKEVLENYTLDQATPALLRLLADVAR